MGNRLDKPYMEVEGNQTTGKTSIAGWTVLKKTAIFVRGGVEEGGSKLKSDEKNPWGIVQISHIWK